MMNEVIEEVRDLLETAMGTKCKSYFVGNIGAPVKNYLPAIVVKRQRTTGYRANTAKDGYEFSIKIQVIVDIIPQMNVSGVLDRITKSNEKLGDLIEEEDTDGAPKANTVLGALSRKSAIMGNNYVYNIDPVVNYEVETPSNATYIMAEVTLQFIKDFVTRKN